MNAGQFLEYIVRPTLERYLPPEIPSDPAATQLTFGTILHESGRLAYIDQLSPGPGPAYGPGQAEVRTIEDYWRWLRATPEREPLFVKFLGLSLPFPFGPEQLHGNLYLSVAFVRLHYRRLVEPVPALNDFDAQALYYKIYYNTTAGAATTADYLNDGPRAYPELFAGIGA